jgi:RNase P/RNase MRP subunit p29
MARPASGYKVRLEPQDEYTHVPDAAANYNESMYFNMFDPARKIGGWFRIGNRPNEGYAEISVCLYLPDGRVGFMFGRPKISGNAEMNAGGLKIEVVEPFKRLRVTYEGKVLLLERPGEMAHPSKAFRDNPQRPCTIELDYDAVSPMFGGETVKADGGAIEIDPEKSFAKAHYEQHMAARGRFVVGDEAFEVQGFGLRDKSWGPRHWQAINWYRWCPMNFGADFAMMISLVADDEGRVRQGGMVLKDGVYDLITAASIDSDWDESGYQTALRSHVKTESGAEYDVEGRVLSLIPLRNRRKTPDGSELTTRITEGMTKYRCGDRVGYGLSEYLDQIIDGRPTGADLPQSWQVPAAQDAT